MLLLALLGCTEPVELPEDPSEAGVPVGVTTVSLAGETVEVWYPAGDDAVGGESIDVLAWVPDVVQEHLGGVTLPSIDTAAVRDARPRRVGEPLPVLVFSHGFGGMRVQSATLATHLASRGFVVIADDHEGRMLGDVLPCLFDPALEGCDLTGFGSDPAEEDVEDLLDALPGASRNHPFLAELVDPSRVGIVGHSAGGNTSTTLAEDERIDAFVAMAGGRAVERDVPGLYAAGTCDGVVSAEDTEAAALETGAEWLPLAGAGHLAFSDLCDLQLTTWAETYLLERDDLNPTFADGLVALAGDGCPDAVPVVEDPACDGAYVPPEDVEVALRGAVAGHFETWVK